MYNPITETNNLPRIIHAYDSLDDTLVWAIVVNHLPALKSEVKTLLENC